MSDRLRTKVGELAQDIIPAETIRLTRLAGRAIDNEGRPVLGTRKFIELQDIDTGTVYWLRIKSGVVSLVEAPAGS